MSTDTKYMKRALTLAKKGVGKTAPNPAVGCVIVKNGQIVGEGWHKKAGGPHAEIHALEKAGPHAHGADVYVTLEPCSHTGKTPPCSEALIRAGVKRVVAGMHDPNPQVNGGGLKALQQAGIETFCGVLEDECRNLNRAFIKFMTTGLPYVTYKCAMTLDGNIATVTGESRWISCEESRKYVHDMRSRMDAIMVGVDTIITDNPQLTVRHVRGKNPLRIIVDTRLRTPESVNVLSEQLSSGTIIATTESNPRVHLRYLKLGATIVVCDQYEGRVSMKDLSQKLGAMGIQSVLLEGGSHLAGNMLQNGMIDELVIFVAPKVIGSNGFAPFTLQGITSMSQAIKLEFINVCRMGADLIITARPEPLCSPD
ncbi:MAG: bifunctional diaminohydroxyphosphoribosylaminopyrimidine deaminase/5-amino-6-(5-phosphoribosylamino)uracil reductase RibD [Desulfuromonadaceae bacterium]|nr:bifunctional diaminohydroxyphosphoribosylaminopyrimidine deaminase/5-amino-6-(5-phosphoribosylamino)uracil reductase RibD [Desulfuromonadaceae bacterium]MDD2847805.1 bifunctional diaminohydroxyphosphoribosylaminopyrimidine deaminase/5-amino-6-(5-phosphoribosylamino)uracil reductase RibD [Desulfuromonadaceae bacterium]MDD4129650.1 bifunctional diaminohydroxyphosphoribosylaminopyrimidine deaminase/5-amino-6-(5-phosphoribosylamino)uracil reductase RibD [Desulfuromonadaceae bacterium]